MTEGKNVFEGVEVMEIRGTIPGEISALTCDSRAVNQGDLFVALHGTSFDGHQFAREAAQKGACACVVERFVDNADIPQVLVRDTLASLPKIAANFYGHPSRSMRLIGITGSNGKTTTTYILESIWKAAGFSPAVIGTIEYRFGGKRIDAPNTTPLPHDLQHLLRQIADERIDQVIMEVSSHGLVLHRVDEMEFDLALFTNLSQDHLDFHKTMDEYREAKKRLFTEHLNPSGTAVLNIDDPVGMRFKNELRSLRCVTFAIDQPADFQAQLARIELKGSTFIVDIFGKHQLGISTQLVGKHNVYNLLGAIAVAWCADIPMDAIQKGIQRLSAVPGRLESIENSIHAQIVVDYCHTPDALEKCLQTLSAIPHRRIVTLVGCGGDRDPGKRPLMGKIALDYSDFVIVTSDNPRTEDPHKIIRDIEAGMTSGKDRYTVIPDRREAIRAGIDRIEPEDILLIAGKGHETYQIIGRAKYPFDDREIARRMLAETGKGVQ